MAKKIPAGWYPLPDGTQRYWDGSQWTEHIAPGAGTAASDEPAPDAQSETDDGVSETVGADAAAPQEPDSEHGDEAAPVGSDAVTPTPPPAAALPESVPVAVPATEDARPLYKKKRFLIPAIGCGGSLVLFVLLIAIVAAIGAGATSAADDAPATTEAATEAPEPEPSEEPATFEMPDVVGMNLQEAQDLLQSLGSYMLDQQDASGEDRLQLLDSNWKVCSQQPAPGVESPLEATVVLASVKSDEYCPGEEPAEPTTQAAAPEQPASGSDMTVAQSNAVRTAEDYLAFIAFSRQGLIEQLEYEGYSNSDATFAVDHITVDWNEQAAEKAQDYLDMMGFSRSGLIDQLMYEGFTRSEAEYGASAVGL